MILHDSEVSEVYIDSHRREPETALVQHTEGICATFWWIMLARLQFDDIPRCIYSAHSLTLVKVTGEQQRLTKVLFSTHKSAKSEDAHNLTTRIKNISKYYASK